MDSQEQLLQELLSQEDELQFATFGNDDAMRVGNMLVEHARALGKAVTVDIRRNGQQLFHFAMTGTSADNDAWIARKCRVVDRYGRSSFCVGTRFRVNGTSFEAASRLDADRYAAHGGAFPLIIRGVGVVGSIAVSGLPQEQDHALVVKVLREFLAAQAAAAPRS